MSAPDWYIYENGDLYPGFAAYTPKEHEAGEVAWYYRQHRHVRLAKETEQPVEATGGCMLYPGDKAYICVIKNERGEEYRPAFAHSEYKDFIDRMSKRGISIERVIHAEVTQWGDK